VTGYEALAILLGDGASAGPAGALPRVAVPLASHEEILSCIGHAIGRTAEFVLIGDEAAIRTVAARVGADVARARFIAERDEAAACALAARLVHDGESDLLMKGQVQTSTFTRSILDREAGLVEPGWLVSHVTVCGIPRYHKVLLLTDAAINIEPTLEQKVEILRNALAVARALGISRPKVACIAPVETESPKIRSTVDAAALVALAADPRQGLGSLDIQGPLGLDLAISRGAAEIKGVSGPVVGDADILVMPGLDAANALYKSLTAFAGARMASVLAGARVPVVLTSRADSEETKELSLALALRLAGRRR
jgi:phosphate butyryltransferase